MYLGCNCYITTQADQGGGNVVNSFILGRFNHDFSFLRINSHLYSLFFWIFLRLSLCVYSHFHTDFPVENFGYPALLVHFHYPILSTSPVDLSYGKSASRWAPGSPDFMHGCSNAL